LTLIEAPCVAVAGAVRADIVRSGPTTMDLERVLLVSLVSEIAPGPSAAPMMNQVPAAVPLGIVTLVEPADVAPAPRMPTERLPMSWSPLSSTASAER